MASVNIQRIPQVTPPQPQSAWLAQQDVALLPVAPPPADPFPVGYNRVPIIVVIL